MKKYIEEFLLFLKVTRRYSPNTIRAYQIDLRDFFVFLQDYKAMSMGLVDMSGLRVRDFRAWMSWGLGQGRSKTTINRQLSALRSFFKWLEQNYQVSCLELDYITLPKQSSRLIRVIDEADSTRILDACQQIHKQEWLVKRDMALLGLLYGCGLRISEALALSCQDWYDKTTSLRIQGKGNKERIVPLLSTVVLRVDSYVLSSPYDTSSLSPLFRGERGGRLSPRVTQLLMQRIRRQLGLDESITPHALRHAFASHILQNGADLRAIQELLGHSSLISTQKYTKLDFTKLLQIYHSSHPRNKMS